MIAGKQIESSHGSNVEARTTYGVYEAGITRSGKRRGLVLLRLSQRWGDSGKLGRLAVAPEAGRGGIFPCPNDHASATVSGVVQTVDTILRQRSCVLST